MERFFRLHPMLVGDKMHWLSLHLPNLSWKCFKDNGIQHWHDFKIQFGKRYKLSSFVVPRALAELHKQDSVQEYQFEFERLTTQAPYLVPEILVETFIKGLKSDIKIEVMRKRPACIDRIMYLEVQAKFDLSVPFQDQQGTPCYSTQPLQGNINRLVELHPPYYQTGLKTFKEFGGVNQQHKRAEKIHNSTKFSSARTGKTAEKTVGSTPSSPK